MRVSRHNGRAGKHGAYNPKHNDRSFDVTHASNIDQARTDLNLYWDWKNGLRTNAENETGQYPSFTEIEREFYEQQYSDFLAGQSARNKKAGHAKRNRTVDDLLKDIRICPEETIYQIGKEGDSPPAEVLTAIVEEFMKAIHEQFGTHVHMLDWALHLDETTPHIHARQVFDITNAHGEIEPKQEKALELLGIPLPDPDKKPGKTNNRKAKFDSICRDMLLDICKKHGLEVETEPIYGGSKHLEINDFIIKKQNEEIASMKKLNAELTADNEAKAHMLEEKEAKLNTLLAEIADADTVIEAVSNAVYEQAVKDVVQIAVAEAQNADQHIIDSTIRKINSPEIDLGRKEKTILLECLESVKQHFQKAKERVIEKVTKLFHLPDKRQEIMTTVKEKVKPSIRKMLLAYAEKPSGGKSLLERKRTEDIR